MTLTRCHKCTAHAHGAHVEVASSRCVRLASGGEADIVDRSWEGLPSSVKRLTFGASGHLPFVEQKEEFLTQLVDFLDAADGVATNRELKFADLQSTLREATSAESPLRSAGAERDCSAYKTEAARKYCQTSTRS